MGKISQRSKKKAMEPLVQDCLGDKCPFLKDYAVCMHRIEIDDETTLCTLSHENRAHSHSEIAVIMGISRQTVYNLEKRALEKLKKAIQAELQEEGLSEDDLFHKS